MQRTSHGFFMPLVVIMLGAATIILLAIFQYIAATANLTSEIIYRQVALTAAHGALDYGKEQFDNNLNFNGTASELTMFENDTYKVTYKVTVLSTSADGRVKRVQGIGGVYLPKNAATARYTRTINGEIIRSQIVAQDPSDYNPLAWYDASCNASTSTDSACASNTVLKSASETVSANPTSLREERNNGNYCSGSPRTTSPSNSQLDIPKDGECGATNLTHTGFVFNFGNTLPKGATITNATLRLTANAADSTAVTTSIKGLNVDNVSNFTTSSSAQMSGLARTSSVTDWTMQAWSSSGQASNSPNIAGAIQEIINRPGWNSGNNIGLVIEHKTGSGKRRARITQITLSVTYTGGQQPADSGDAVQVWRDRSGNGFDLTAPSSGARPTKGTASGNGLNNKPMINFTSSSSWLRASVNASTGRTANNYTAFALMKVKSGTNTSGNGYLASFYGSGTGNTAFSPFWRHPYQGFHSYDSGSGTSDNFLCVARGTGERICKSSLVSIAGGGSWQLWSSREAVTERDALMRRNGNNPNFGQSKFYDPIELNAPYSIIIGANPQTSTPNSDMEIAELIFYDRQLTCPQMESVEIYLKDKWGLSGYGSEGCTENNIPAY